MPDLNEKVRARDTRTKWLLVLVSVATLVVLAAAALQENILAEWQVLRRAYAGILHEKAGDARGEEIADKFEVIIEQNVLADLGAIDRCITCHTGLEDPRMKDQVEPFRTHPGRYLEFHDPNVFGCTVCHQGQGRATETADAHGDVAHWDYPLLAKGYMKSACSKCHPEEGLYGPEGLLARADEPDTPAPSTDLLHRGRALMAGEGCLGCHALKGKGGTLSLDITYVGEKTYHELDFSHFGRDEPRHVAYWHKKHFLHPLEAAPGSIMPPVLSGEGDADALTAYMLSLRRPAPAAYWRDLYARPESPLSGKDLYALYCSACHGDDGLKTEAPEISTPALNNFDTLAVAEDDYYRFIIAGGRSGTKMTSWKAGSGNLSRAEIDRIVEHIRGWEPAGPQIKDVKSHLGDPRIGRSYFRGLCASCHGGKGEGGIGNTLNAPTFLALASDPFLSQTTIHGRPGTAMPSWKHLPAQGISDILAYIRQWQPEKSSWDAVEEAISSTPPAENARIGRYLYLAHCAACHGRQGEGGIGLFLNSSDVLRAVDNRYLYRTLAEGRPSTAMPAWRHLSAEDAGAILAFIRSWNRSSSLELTPPPRRGDYSVGEVYYRDSCLRCHGEEGQGGVGPQLNNLVFLRSVSDAVLLHWIGRGRTGTAMKGFLAEEQGPTQLLPHQISDIIAYLRHLGLRDERPLLRTGVGNAVLGAQLFRGNCSSCHGPDGEGTSGPQLNNQTFLSSASDGFLAGTIALGRTGTPMQSMIHGMEGLGQISPSQVQDIIAFMRLWDFHKTWSRPRVMAEMSERAITIGKEGYAGYCSSCHGPKGLGAEEGPQYFAPSLNNPDFLDAASDGFLLATIARGRSGTPMRPFGKGSGGIVSLPSDQISDIVSFIRTWQEKDKPKGVPLP